MTCALAMMVGASNPIIPLSQDLHLSQRSNHTRAALLREGSSGVAAGVSACRWLYHHTARSVDCVALLAAATVLPPTM